MFSLNDAPIYKGLYFQDPATSIAEQLILFHDQIVFYFIVGTIGVLWALIDILVTKKTIPMKHLSHGSTLEIIWTAIPAIILIWIAIPSFRLLYLMDEILDPTLTVKATGLQWYWNYEYSDFLNTSLNFDSYCLKDSDLELGQLRLLEVDNRLILPIQTHIRVVTTAQDVMHCFAVPALAVRTDAIPGRLNSFSFLIKRAGVFRGICAELCGSAHYQMPIVIQAVSLPEFANWISKELEAVSLPD